MNLISEGFPINEFDIEGLSNKCVLLSEGCPINEFDIGGLSNK